jgi:polyferredoxin
MAKKRKTSWLVWLRRFTQTFFVWLFFYLFLHTVYSPINRTEGPLKLFFDLDPLVALNTWLASHTIERAMMLSAATLIVTLLFGRWFCGWICPFGAIHNFATSLRGGAAKSKLEVGGYTSWQKLKYYLLSGLLVAGVVGVNVIGWLDPFSFLFRSLATSIFPAFNRGIVVLFTWLYDVNPGVGAVRATVVTEPVYDFLRKHVLAVEQPHYFGSALIGVLFLTVIALNFFRARFWCRYLCPLGALLGVFGQRPLVRLKTNTEECNNCRLCLKDCQGGAAQQEGTEWRPSECFFCCNCISDCPSGAVGLSVGLKREKKDEGLVTLDR